MNAAIQLPVPPTLTHPHVCAAIPSCHRPTPSLAPSLHSLPVCHSQPYSDTGPEPWGRAARAGLPLVVPAKAGTQGGAEAARGSPSRSGEGRNPGAGPGGAGLSLSSFRRRPEPRAGPRRRGVPFPNPLPPPSAPSTPSAVAPFGPHPLAPLMHPLHTGAVGAPCISRPLRRHCHNAAARSQAHSRRPEIPRRPPHHPSLRRRHRRALLLPSPQQPAQRRRRRPQAQGDLRHRARRPRRGPPRPRTLHRPTAASRKVSQGPDFPSAASSRSSPPATTHG